LGLEVGTAAIGAAAIAAGAGAFAALAVLLDTGPALASADQALADALHASLAPPVLKVFAVLTHLGDVATLTALCLGVAVALVACGRRGLALGWVVAVAGNGVLNEGLKRAFTRARPLHADGLVTAQGYSFPSGHSSGAVVAYGMLAYLALRLLPARWQWPALLAAVALAFTVGASRIFLRVHFASDVAAGFASGAAWLALCITAIELHQWGHINGVRSCLLPPLNMPCCPLPLSGGQKARPDPIAPEGAKGKT
jgi:undecaprenyl-diphosphatase